MVAERIRHLREQNHWTQAKLAKQLGLTRASVNAWEMGIPMPSTQYVMELAQLFMVSTDYLLGRQATASVDVNGLTEEDITLVIRLISHLRKRNS